MTDPKPPTLGDRLLGLMSAPGRTVEDIAADIERLASELRARAARTEETEAVLYATIALFRDAVSERGLDADSLLASVLDRVGVAPVPVLARPHAEDEPPWGEGLLDLDADPPLLNTPPRKPSEGL